jgi:alpha-D-ribose 1-methylphosphonate 5-triphosphate synthase subunit PhnH
MTSTLTKKYDFDPVFDSQKVFRLILEAISNPTRVVNIKESADKLFGSCPELLAVAMTLLDNEMDFGVVGNDSLAEDIVSLTRARRAKIESADFLFVCDLGGLKAVIETVKCGTLSDPHKSATVVIRNGGEPTYRLTLSGPGIDGCAEITASQSIYDAIVCRDAQNYEYPQGIDLIFVTGAGELIAIPRLVRVVR